MTGPALPGRDPHEPFPELPHLRLPCTRLERLLEVESRGQALVVVTRYHPLEWVPREMLHALAEVPGGPDVK